MDFNFTPEQVAFRQEVKDFIAKEIPPEFEAGVGGHVESDADWKFARSITKKLSQKGWLNIAWPEQYGGKDAHMFSVIINDEFNYRGAPGLDFGGIGMLAPALMAHGNEEQKKEHLGRIARGEVIWCQGWSEPGAGSDLPAMTTKAVEDGDRRSGPAWRTTPTGASSWLRRIRTRCPSTGASPSSWSTSRRPASPSTR